jgi:hypothetical protein
MKTSALTALVIANACVLMAGFFATRFGLIDPMFAVPSLIVGMQLAAVALGVAVAVDRRNRQRAEEECFPSTCV